MIGKPYSSLDAGMGPLIRDMKNKICQDCELFALLKRQWHGAGGTAADAAGEALGHGDTKEGAQPPGPQGQPFYQNEDFISPIIIYI